MLLILTVSCVLPYPPPSFGFIWCASSKITLSFEIFSGPSTIISANNVPQKSPLEFGNSPNSVIDLVYSHSKLDHADILRTLSSPSLFGGLYVYLCNLSEHSQYKNIDRHVLKYLLLNWTQFLRFCFTSK